MRTAFGLLLELADGLERAANLLQSADAPDSHINWAGTCALA